MHRVPAAASQQKAESGEQDVRHSGCRHRPAGRLQIAGPFCLDDARARAANFRAYRVRGRRESRERFDASERLGRAARRIDGQVRTSGADAANRFRLRWVRERRHGYRQHDRRHDAVFACPHGTPSSLGSGADCLCRTIKRSAVRVRIRGNMYASMATAAPPQDDLQPRASRNGWARNACITKGYGMGARMRWRHFLVDGQTRQVTPSCTSSMPPETEYSDLLRAAERRSLCARTRTGWGAKPTKSSQESS